MIKKKISEVANICLERDFLMHVPVPTTDESQTEIYDQHNSVFCCMWCHKKKKVVKLLQMFVISCLHPVNYNALSYHCILRNFSPFRKKKKMNLNISQSNISQSMNYPNSTMWIQNRNMYT